METEQQMNALEKLTEPLVKWYRQNKRSLPWRDQGNAYYTWVSEIMLQQTRVEAVKPYFIRFVRELPDIPDLAACPDERLLKLWEGLGYYNRVRNMQKAAVTVTEQFGGRLPPSYEQLLSLCGIGRYTAGAIASIAYGIPVPAVDGNVLRVISRITENRGDIQKQSVRNKIEEQLGEIIPRHCPGDFNQALMELGATVCVPGGPARCGVCPAADFCLGRKNGTWQELPVKKQKAPRNIEERTVLVIQDGERTAIRRRPPEGLLAGLYEFPCVSGKLTDEEALNQVRKMELEPLYIEKLEPSRHIFSHIEWRMTAYRIRVSSLEPPGEGDLIFVEKKQSERNYAIPSAFRAYLRYLREETR